MHVLTLEKLAKDGLLAGKRVLIRSDLNAPHDENGPWAYRPTGRVCVLIAFLPSFCR